MKIEVTLERFPSTGEAKKECGLPFGVAVTPLGDNSQLIKQAPGQSTDFASIPRCKQCFSYINVYCNLHSIQWDCAVCGYINVFDPHLHSNFMKIAADRCPLPLLSNLIDLRIYEKPPIVDIDDIEDQSNRICDQGYPVTIAVLDTHCDDDWLEAMKTAVASSLEVLPPKSLFGLISFGDRIRLYDVKSSIPKCRSVKILDKIPLLAALEDVLPLEQLLAPIEDHKQLILQTLDIIESTGTDHLPDVSTAAPSHTDVTREEPTEPASSGQAFGTVLQALLQYLGPLDCSKDEYKSDRDTTQCARILSFLAGPPTMGLGDLSDYHNAKTHLRSTDHDDQSQQLFEEMSKTISDFYDQTALVAASIGVVLDLFVLSPYPIGLEVLSSLADHTGGGIWLYSSISDALIAQDLYRHLSMTHAHTCLLRIRHPPELKVAKSYGSLMKDPLYDIYHILTCDPYTTFCIDLEHSNELHPIVYLQVAFQYTIPVIQSDDRGQFELEKRLRIMTTRFETSPTMTDIISHIREQTVTAFLTHKVLAAVKIQGTSKAAVLLQDWLIILAASFNKNYEKNFVECDSVQPLIRLVYGMLRSQILLGSLVRPQDDRRVYMVHHVSGLPPEDMRRVFYPHLMSFVSPFEKAFPQHSLSRMAMQLSQAQIFLMDAYDSIIVYYTTESDQPYPPPADSLVAKTVEEIGHNRKRAANYYTVRETDLGAKDFSSRLIDEPMTLETQIEGESGIAFNGFLEFVEWIRYAAEDFSSS